ncbi:ketoacyl-ACP synthase III family protein [Streptomyces europaeiscabiei]|uniref:ketoacyl-ACP synthase III family protein n=1 Tax=Streptomyces TaxID=1883 RepID=UPI0015C5190A|nr:MULTISPECIES: ketoacyl-ACP synthase III family protein [Streptomyces]MDX3585856.1 ketoacyl-ACP synthase III family protein [Streptomyces europaeiscabiei]MDX3635991.1 ketoacyl-ACP synthase III family protein [Streptomyces europaeiscabiei]MDX3654067.1 ketoacyl-ACP synthase III family protein [Streptomyces europaeiscabiei]WUD31019.1 ketoacyl-ACP synthase III family protein [Streptomyces europaeiscabiei]
MRIDNVFIDSLGVVLHEFEPVERAVAQGLISQETVDANGLTGTHLAHDIPAVELAVSAARVAMERSKLQLEDITDHVHSGVYYQGPQGSYPPGYILRELEVEPVSSLYLRQGCNGMLGALEVAVGQMTGAAQAETVLLTSGENFTATGLNRYSGLGQAYFLADGGAAALISADEGFAQIRSLSSGILPELERWHRGDGSLLPDEGRESDGDMAERATRYSETETPLSETLEKLTLFNLGVIRRALVDADLNADDIAKVVPINMDGRMIEYSVMMPLGLTMDRSTWDFGRGIGHVGGADVFITLEHLVRTREVAPGDHVLLISQGPGWMCTACVVTLVDLPTWAI